MINTTILPPFKKMCVTIGNLPTSFMESMSYYEALCWLYDYFEKTLLPAINTNSAAITELQTAFTTLKSYIDDYFENLDVQEEIDKKLDEMAGDGSLANLIKNYVDPIYQAYETEINNEITAQNESINEFKTATNAALTNLDSKIDSVSSGSPLVANSLDDMTDTTKTYVLTTDGYWYYYNGSSWTQGGLYQSVQLGDNTVTYENLENELKSGIKSINTTTNVQPTLGKVITTTGAEVESSPSYGYYEISVNPYESYELYINFNTSASLNVRYMFKYNDNVISYTDSTTMPTPTDNYYREVVNIPYNVNKLIVNATGFAEYSKTYINKVSKYVPKDIEKNQLSSTMQTLFTDTYTEVTPTLFIPSCYIGNNRTFTSYSSTSVYSLTVTPNTKYKISALQVYGNPLIWFCTNNNSYNTTVAGNTYVTKPIPEKVLSETSGYQFENYEFTTPEYCTTIYISRYNVDSSFKISTLKSLKCKLTFLNWYNHCLSMRYIPKIIVAKYNKS